MSKDSRESSGKKAIWSGLSAACSLVLAVSIGVGGILEGYKATIDTQLGTTSEKLVSKSTEDEPLYSRFTPSKEVLNEDGTGNSHALIEKAMDLNRRQASEGAVLIKNSDVEGQGLPIAQGSNVTLLGIRSEIPMLGSSFGLRLYGPCITLEQALSQNKTDFAHTIVNNAKIDKKTGEMALTPTISEWTGEEFEFDGAGMQVNPVMSDIYAQLNGKYKHGHSEMTSPKYDPMEPSVDEITQTNPDFKSSFAEYGDAAIVVVSRPFAESIDYQPGGVVEGLGAEEPLQLTNNERDAIKLAKEASDNVVVILNTSNPVEIKELADDPEVDAILWIGFPGAYGMLGVADVLSGKVNPSGALVDTYATKNMSAPAMQNMGDFEYANADQITREDSKNYVVEAEGIYSGYRYYETRYYDAVMGKGNATSTVGAYASNGGWNYADEVVYPFGHGLSYTTFSKQFEGEPVVSIEKDAETGCTNAFVTFNVKVTNTGDVAGKTPVQIYGQAPYVEGGVEKSAIQLLNFEKSKLLEPGESQVVPVKVDLEYIASYDASYDNGDGTFGTYVMDPGTYWFSIGDGSHDAVNAVMAAQGVSASRLTGKADASRAWSLEVTEDVLPRDAFSITKTGAKVSNQLDYADWNHFQPGEVTYLSRADWAGTWPKTYTGLTVTNEQLLNDLNGKYYQTKTDDDTSAVKWDQKSDVMIWDLAGRDFDDPLYNEATDKMSLEEALYLDTFGGPSIPGIASLGSVEHYMTENAGNGVVVALNATKDPGAPWAIPADDVNAAWNPTVFGNAVLTAACFNNDLYYELGSFIGEESLFTGIAMLWGPGLNTHRHAYNGRNGEYYSEDPVLCGNAAMEFAIGALNYGLIASPKHFAFNDQETNRAGIAPYMTEQRAREAELRAWQIAFEATKYDTEDTDAGMRGLMTSFSKIGSVECTVSRGLMTNILKDEWGFQGYAVTDIYDDTDLWTAVLTSGVTCFDTRGMSGFYGSTTLETCPTFSQQVDGSTIGPDSVAGDATVQAAAKESAHNMLYAMAQSNLMNRYNSTSHVEQQMTWWRGAYIAAIAVSGLLTLGCAALYVRSDKSKKGEVK